MDEIRLKRLRFRAWRRGFKEADLILGPFADKHGQDLTPEQLDAFETLLEQPDQDLYEWIIERRPTPAEFDNDVMRMLKQFRFEAFEARGGGDGG
ncbi:succinate dehydrogenase assembly factor 2 [Phenylobacterium terrae]|uniref:FAD assembly factor SdhE n=1 Tax=Phenylobacterium terrae TaxID=2665495 RepID=A0ABW4N4L4_9CAUL